MNDRIDLEIENHVALVHINRPEKHNALDREAFEALLATGEALGRNSSVRAVVLAGAGESFCSGIDMSVFDSEGVAAAKEELMQLRGPTGNLYQSAATVWRELPVPVIAAVHGVAYGAGLQIAMGADIRVAAPSARFSIMEIRWGIIPDMGLTVTMRHVVPADKIRLLAYTGKVIDGTDALRLNLVTELNDDPLGAARQLAAAIAERSPEAVRAIKSLLNESLDEPPAEALRREAQLQLSLLGSAGNREAVMANLHKRAPRFEDPE
jgi:enoyl-CoA hydratase/carnithine racemase